MFLNKNAQKIQKRAKSATASVEDSVDVFLRLNDNEDATEVESHGVRMVNKFGQLYTARIAVKDVEAVGRLKSVKMINTGEKLQLHNDSARIATFINMVQSGAGALGKQYTGKGVVVGIVDSGIEYNHLNFKDANGKSRVKMVYDALNHKTYIDRDVIATLTTDNTNEAHGTHTTGTAAGSYTKNGYQGMAPEADLILCGTCGDFTTPTVINAFNKIFDYANLVNEPAVINFSVGGNDGPHDGTDDFNQTLNSMKAKGNIVVISAGNEGGFNLYLKQVTKNEDDTEQFKTIIVPSDDKPSKKTLTYIVSHPTSLKCSLPLSTKRQAKSLPKRP